MSTVLLKDLKKVYDGNVVAVHDVNLEIADKEFSVLDFVLAHGMDGLTRDDLRAMLRFANAAAYLVTTRRGAIRSMPQRQQVEAILNEH